MLTRLHMAPDYAALMRAWCEFLSIFFFFLHEELIHFWNRNAWGYYAYGIVSS